MKALALALGFWVLCFVGLIVIAKMIFRRVW